jgi:hypothetical protein
MNGKFPIGVADAPKTTEEPKTMMLAPGNISWVTASSILPKV